MSKDLQQEIVPSPVEAARQILDRVKPDSLPIPVVKVAESLGAKVVAKPRLGQPGMLEHYEGHTFLVINDDLEYESKRSAIASLIGKYFLEKNNFQIKNNNIIKYGEINNLYNKWINEFSTSLLMPEEKFANFYLKSNNIQKTADNFGVSHLLAKLQAYKLGLEELSE